MILVTVTDGDLVIQEYFFDNTRRDEIVEVLADMEVGWRMEKKV